MHTHLIFALSIFGPLALAKSHPRRAIHPARNDEERDLERRCDEHESSVSGGGDATQTSSMTPGGETSVAVSTSDGSAGSGTQVIPTTASPTMTSGGATTTTASSAITSDSAVSSSSGGSGTASATSTGASPTASAGGGTSGGAGLIKGVNLGGWLVLEPFITPDQFAPLVDAAVDEWTFCELQDRATAEKTLKQHWDTWITEDDLKQIATAGLTHVRIPIGFWAFDVSGGEPYIQGAAEYLDKAIGWAKKYKLKVLVDLHGAPGSQNGYDNSGHRGELNWHKDPKNVARTITILKDLSAKYSAPEYADVVTMLGLLNEPATYMYPTLANFTRGFWSDAYAAAKKPYQTNHSESGLEMVIHDGFNALDSYTGFMTDANVTIDNHNYQVFSPDQVAMNETAHIQAACAKAQDYAKSPFPVIVGEWSLATTDCAPDLNGRGTGNRYEGTFPYSPFVASCNGKSTDPDNFTDEYKTYLRKFWDVQTQIYNSASKGYFFWTWKTQTVADWSYQAGLSGGWIPWDINEHKFSLEELCGISAGAGDAAATSSAAAATTASATDASDGATSTDAVITTTTDAAAATATTDTSAASSADATTSTDETSSADTSAAATASQ